MQPASITVPDRRPPRRTDLPFLLLCSALVLLTVVAAMFGKGRLPVALAPTLLAVLLWILWKLPVRHALLALVFLGLTLECPQEIPAAGGWKSPLYPLGEVLLSKANDWTYIKPLVFTGVDVAVAYLVFLLIWRRATGSMLDTTGRVQTAGVLALAAGISFFGMIWIWGWGLAQGGDFGNSLLQVYKLLYIPILFFVFQAALRGPADHAAIAKVIIGAAVCRSLLAMYVRATVVPLGGEAVLPYATTHGDSMLFASGAALVIALMNERVGRRVRGFRFLLLVCLALITGGMVANNRRVVWVELAAIVATFFLTVGWTPLKRLVTRAAIVSLPVIALYMAIGWNSEGGVFAPVHLARSVLDSKSDSSTMWRDLENIDLILTIQQSPLFGTGLGHEYAEPIKLPDVSGAFPLYRYFPHNSLLGFLGFAGIIGFTLMWCMLTVALLLAARSYYLSKAPLDRAMALWVIATMVAYFNSVYADMGQGSWTAVFTVCPALGVAAKLAIASGAWPARRRAYPQPAAIAAASARMEQAPASMRT